MISEYLQIASVLFCLLTRTKAFTHFLNVFSDLSDDFLYNKRWKKIVESSVDISLIQQYKYIYEDKSSLIEFIRIYNLESKSYILVQVPNTSQQRDLEEIEQVRSQYLTHSFQIETSEGFNQNKATEMIFTVYDSKEDQPISS